MTSNYDTVSEALRESPNISCIPKRCTILSKLHRRVTQPATLCRVQMEFWTESIYVDRLDATASLFYSLCYLRGIDDTGSSIRFRLHSPPWSFARLGGKRASAFFSFVFAPIDLLLLTHISLPTLSYPNRHVYRRYMKIWKNMSLHEEDGDKTHNSLLFSAVIFLSTRSLILMLLHIILV